MNPWFFQRGDTAVARPAKYCVAIDEAHFGVTRRHAETHVASVLKYWFDELTSAYVPTSMPYGAIYVGYEHFVPARCDDEDVVLRFQLGELTPEQRSTFDEMRQDPTRFVAVAVRTQYDPVTMQGRGFIYVSPPRGPLAMQSQTMIDDPWARDDQQRLDWVLRHELGHVFGVQHNGSHEELMGVGAPEYAISSATVAFRPWLKGVFKTVYGATIALTCSAEPGPSFLRTFFSLPGDTKCVGLRLQPDRLEVVYTMDPGQQTPRVGGRASLDLDSAIVQHEPVVRIFLPDGQAVFQNVPAVFGRVLPGPMATSRQMTATYRPAAGAESRELHLSLQPGSIQVSGIWNGRIVMDVMSHDGP
jgi:hypothetical protein